MLNFLINMIFRITPLREAVIAEVHMYDEADRIINDPEASSIAAKCWQEDGLWRGWQIKDNRYIFHDLGYNSFTDIFEGEE